MGAPHPEPSEAAAVVSVGQHVLVVGHGVHVVTGFVGVGPRHPLRRRPGGRVMPGAEVAENLLRHPSVINDGDDAHGVLADGAAERVHVPDVQNKGAPAFGGKLDRRRRMWWRCRQRRRYEGQAPAPVARVSTASRAATQPEEDAANG